MFASDEGVLIGLGLGLLVFVLFWLVMWLASRYRR